MPEEIEKMEDLIMDICCGSRHSIITTRQGMVWATGNLKEEKIVRL